MSSEGQIQSPRFELGRVTAHFDVDLHPRNARHVAQRGQDLIDATGGHILLLVPVHAHGAPRACDVTVTRVSPDLARRDHVSEPRLLE